MENPNNKANESKIKFEDKEYLLESLPKEAKDLVSGLKVAEAQLRMYQDTLKLINVSKTTMIVDLKKILDNIEPIS